MTPARTTKRVRSNRLEEQSKDMVLNADTVRFQMRKIWMRSLGFWTSDTIKVRGPNHADPAMT